MKKLTLLALALTALLVAGALYALTSADTAAIGVLQTPVDAGAFSECPRDILCLDVWDPVICDDGKIYSNSCYAYRACATGCSPLFDGPMF